MLSISHLVRGVLVMLFASFLSGGGGGVSENPPVWREILLMQKTWRYFKTERTLKEEEKGT